MRENHRSDTADYRSVFLDDRPLIDTRAPTEFIKGSFPTAINLPLMSDSEREAVGTCYKQRGQQAAIALGHELVSGKTKEARVSAWVQYARDNPDGYLFCFRGGLRSQISQHWLHEAGIDYPRITGGYKAMRNFLIDELEIAAHDCRFTILSGMTGTGKTEIIAQLSNAIDLEGHANHRGSSFGKKATPQPTQINFENGLAIDLLKRRARKQNHFVLEDESRLIGKCSIPFSLHRKMQQSPIVWLEDDFEQRVDRILDDYVIKLCDAFIRAHGRERGAEIYAASLRQNLFRIAKRLGGKRFQEVDAIMQEALRQQLDCGDTSRHRCWITLLLRDYYDPMYQHQIASKAERTLYRGRRHEVIEYLQAGSD
ncbi:tRNA 2-selenouridine(34) synthase MnmH [Microbulbifer sp. ARAS458-1]|uniref:tRNA 2-selenouridine(34) synthase MnmH n=1 Tax=Microbulbifer sp. ARAS458-1 TaxID=3140242 RepID=UPI003877DE9A